VKIPPLILLSACLAFSAVSAESPFTDVPASPTNAETAAREAAMRRALQRALAGKTNNAPGDTVTAAGGVVDTNAAPANPGPSNLTRRPFPAFPAFPVNTNQPSRPRPIPVVPAANATNAVPGAGVAGGLPATAPTAPPATTAPAVGAAAAPNPNAPTTTQTSATGVSTNAAEPVVAAGEINFPATDINQVLSIYGDLVNRTILRPTALPAQLITLKTQTPLTRTEAIQAFDTVFAMNGITTINVGDKFVKVVPTAQAAAEAAVFDTNDMIRLPEADQYVTHIIQVTNAKPSELVAALQPFAKVPNSILAIDSSGILVIRDFSANVKRMLEMIKQIDIATPLDYDSEVIPIKYALAADIQSALSSLGGGGSATSIGRSSTGGTGAAGAGFSPGGYGRGTLGGGGGVGGLGTPGQQLGGTQPGVGGLNSSTRGASFQDRLRNIVQKASSSGDFQILGQTKIIADERTNSLLVFAGKQDMKMIKDIIKKLDVVLAQVLIEAIIMEVTLDDTRNLGISYLQRNPSQGGNYFTGTGAINNGSFANFSSFASTATNAAGALPSGFSYLGRFGNDFDATLTAIETDNRINVLSRPTIQTSHAVPATLEIGDTVPYVTGTYFGGINGAASSQYQQTFVGINLQVTPLINPDGLVVMDISQDIQQLGTPTIIDNNPVPTTTKRSAQAKVSVRDRDTIILGGFISSTKSKSKSGVPFLKDIPVLGYLFRSTSDSNKRVELIVLIRPTVLPTPEAAALVATSERNKLPGVKAAEAEYRKDELRRLKEADKIKVPDERP
jgi:general secretion pathway protein D